MSNLSFTTKFLKAFSLITVLTLGYAHQGFAAAAYGDEEDPLARIEKNVAGLYISAVTPNPQGIPRFNTYMRTMGWDINTSSNFKVGTKKDGKNYRVIIAQHQNSLLRTSASELESAEPVPLKSLRPILNTGSSLGEYISKEEFISFMKKLDLSSNTFTVPASFKTAYSRVEDKDVFLIC